MNAGKLSTGPSSKSKKAGMKREGSPYDPYKRKARGKENKPGANCTGLFACERPRGREGIRKRLVSAAVEDALKAFCGRRRNPAFDRCPRKDPCEERLWAKFAWRCGWGLLRELTLQGKAEMAEHRKPLADKDKPKVLQDLINPFWRKRGSPRRKAARVRTEKGAA